MTALIQVLQALAAFLAGLVVRASVVLGMMLVLALPVALVALAIHGWRVLRERRLGLTWVSGLRLRPSVHYAPTHTWLAERRDGRLTIGLDDLALRLLPAVTGVVVARPGTEVAVGDPIATIFAGSRQIDVPAPVAGRVVGGNRAVKRDPALLQREGYGRGWLVTLAPADASHVELPTDVAAEAFLAREASRWNTYLEEALGFAAADGGTLRAPAPYLLDERSWLALGASFLGPRSAAATTQASPSSGSAST
jgi:glycine cleavage system H protein